MDKTVKIFKHEEAVRLFRSGQSVAQIVESIDSTEKYVKSVLFRKNLLRRKGKYELRK